jgi:predicted phage terminase large subunit-like protein
MTPYMTQAPTPKQAAYLLVPNREAFYGGAAGGGKSSALLMAALQYVDVPGYAALLLRRTYADLALPGALMDRAHDWLGGTDARWDEQNKTWRFPASATITFGYLEHENDKYRYQGSEFQMIGFDEATQFSETQYRYLFSRLRRLAAAAVPLRMRPASNPGGIGHDWVKQRFIVEGLAEGRIFIPAKLDDNPYLDAAEYRQSLMQLDPITRAQLLAGDWSARAEGALFRRQWFPIVDAAPADARRVRAWDLAATEARPGKDPDWTAGCLMAESHGVYYIQDVRRMRGTPLQVEALVRQTAELDGRAVPIWLEQEPGSAGVNTIDHYTRRVLPGFTFRGNRATGSKSERAAPLASQAEAGNVRLARGAWCGAFLDEAESFPQGTHDDQVDAASAAFEKLARRGLPFGFIADKAVA